MINHGTWKLALQNLEFLAGGWEKQGDEAQARALRQRELPDHRTADINEAIAATWWTAANDLRTLLIAYLEPELPVRYFYASQWRVGTLLIPPTENRPHWSIQRSDVGAMVDQVQPSADRIRVYVEGTEPPGG